ncbi:hypothetical protein SAVIM338S_05520 [Streptomyces avidinii]
MLPPLPTSGASQPIQPSRLGTWCRMSEIAWKLSTVNFLCKVMDPYSVLRERRQRGFIPHDPRSPKPGIQSYNRCMPKHPTESAPARVRTVGTIERTRTARGFAQRELTGRVTMLGRPMSNTTLPRIECARRRCDVDDLVAIAAGLGVSVRPDPRCGLVAAPLGRCRVASSASTPSPGVSHPVPRSYGARGASWPLALPAERPHLFRLASCAPPAACPAPPCPAEGESLTSPSRCTSDRPTVAKPCTDLLTSRLTFHSRGQKGRVPRERVLARLEGDVGLDSSSWTTHDRPAVPRATHSTGGSPWRPSGFEVIEATDCRRNTVVKYVASNGQEAGDAVRDLSRARRYLNREINRLRLEREHSHPAGA